VRLKMNAENYKLCERLISATYVRQGADARKTLENKFRQLLEQVKFYLLFPSSGAQPFSATGH